MKKAYIIIAHKSPNQVYRLIARLNDGNSAFFLHIDKKVAIEPFLIMNAFGAIIHFLDRFDAAWGGYGTIKPFLAGLAAVKDATEQFDRILLISGQDYPIKSNKQIDDFFLASDKSVFLNYFPLPNYKRWPGGDRGGLYRVDKYYFGMKWYQVLASKSMNLMAGYLPFLRRTIPNGMLPFIGQTWWILDRYAADLVLQYHKVHPEYIAFHQYSFVPDEMFVQMIVGNLNDERLQKSIDNTEKRFTIWKDIRDAHPKILDWSDFSAIAAADDLFARKFDENIDREILDLIDLNILHANIDC